MSTSSPIACIIFDCDGVLVDSEGLSAHVLMEMMTEVGFPITEEIFRADFLGRSFATAAARAEKRFGARMPEDFQLRYRTRLLQRMEQALLPMEGVVRVLENLTVPYCLATSSSPQRLAKSLSTTGLARFFDGRCSTASEVLNGKPAPDIFLLAARRMSMDPAECLVVEDSEMGIRAAKAAGMPVWHFKGGIHMKSGYELPADLLPERGVADMAELFELLCDAGVCRRVGVATH